MTLPEALARPLLAGMFVYGGLDSVRNGDSKAGAADKVVGPLAAATGIDAAQFVKINGAVQVGAGLAMALGIFPRPAAAVLALSLVPTTLAGHPFWEEDDPAKRRTQTIHLLKNVAMFGGLLLAATSTGGRPSVPWRAKRAVGGVIGGASERLGDIRHTG